jgi:integrase
MDYLRNTRMDTFKGEPIDVLLFEPTEDIPIHYSALRMTKHFRAFLASNGVPNPRDFTPKSLRSGAAQSLLDAGASSIAIQAHGRWSNPNTPVGSYLNRPTQSRPQRD